MTIEPTTVIGSADGTSYATRAERRAAATLARGMADKPRVKAPKQRAATADESARRAPDVGDRRRAVGARARRSSPSRPRSGSSAAAAASTPEELRTKLEAAGCTFQVAPALEGVHSIADPAGASGRWNTDPADVRAALRHRRHLRDLRGRARARSRRAQPRARRDLHPLRRGRARFDRRRAPRLLRRPQDGHDHGAARPPRDKFALGAWVVDGDTDTGFLAKCTAFDEDAASSFLRSCSSAAPSASIRQTPARPLAHA